MRTEVHKFGGTSVAGAERMHAVAELVLAAAPGTRLVVVASAMAGVTDALEAVGRQAAQGRRDEALAALAAIVARHSDALAALAAREGMAARDVDLVRRELAQLGDELAELLRAVAWMRELTPKTRCVVLAMGEKLSVRLLALAVRALGLAARALDADLFLDTEAGFGESAPLYGVCERTIAAALEPRLAAGEVPIVTGFCGRGPDGATTLLGRGGSDFSATLLGGALCADLVVIWTDVDGVFSADPRTVPEARVLEQINFREAAELSFYGAKVVHQRAMIPVASRGIPVRVKNSLRPAARGTLIDGRFTPGSHPVKGISAVRGQALVSVEGKGLAGVPGVAARLFSALAAKKISVTMISQSSSESSICLAVSERDAVAAELELKRAFRSHLAHGEVEDIAVQLHVGLVAAVGLGMAHTPGVAARIFAALAARGVNVLSIAQGSSELNVSLGVDEGEVDEAVRALHREFGLHRLDTGEERPGGLDLVVFGFGAIGRALVELVHERAEHVRERFGLVPRVVAVADRSGFLLAPRGLAREVLTAAAEHKRAGRPLAAFAGAVASGEPEALVRAALAWRLSRPVLIDATNAEGAEGVLLAALRGGCDVVTANKEPLAGPLALWRELGCEARAAGRVLRAEATVGAGLPIVDTLDMLLATGDRLRRAEGCLSGTLGFLMTCLEEGRPFSQSVLEAARLGYTEPDPVVDLTGRDVARKAVILARQAGLVDQDVEVALEGLVDPALAGLARDELARRLVAYDEPLRARVARCRAEGRALRYLARVEPGSIAVGPCEVPADSPLGMLRGPDNMIVFHSDRYAERPLVVSGPGAGVQVTAMGVLSDVLRIAAERR